VPYDVFPLLAWYGRGFGFSALDRFGLCGPNNVALVFAVAHGATKGKTEF
jgi:hypothetical protein